MFELKGTRIVLYDAIRSKNFIPTNKQLLRNYVKEYSKFQQMTIATSRDCKASYENMFTKDMNFDFIEIPPNMREMDVFSEILSASLDYEYVLIHPLNNPHVSKLIVAIFTDLILDHTAVVIRENNIINPWYGIYDVAKVLNRLDVEVYATPKDFLENLEKTLVLSDSAFRQLGRMKNAFKKIRSRDQIKKAEKWV